VADDKRSALTPTQEPLNSNENATAAGDRPMESFGTLLALAVLGASAALGWALYVEETRRHQQRHSRRVVPLKRRSLSKPDQDTQRAA
jgi:hypothetical protein